LAAFSIILVILVDSHRAPAFAAPTVYAALLA